uniref:Fcf2 domain-containing protein n=1 Tax=Echinostoma caproni TaxID=27848 RepID=A0A183B1I7_9TREM
LFDCSSEYLVHCPVDYSLVQNPFSKKVDNLDPEDETKLWQSLGIVRLMEEPNSSETAVVGDNGVENPIYSTSVPALHSKREIKRIRREDREDLEVIRMRRALSTETHVRRSDTKAKYFQKGVVVDDPGSFYDRLPRKQRGKTIVDELLANAELMRQQRRRYSKIERENAEKRSAIRRRKQQLLKKLKEKGGKRQRTVVVPT